MKQLVSNAGFSLVAIFCLILLIIPIPGAAQGDSQTVEKFHAAIMDLDIAGGIPEIYQRTLSDRLRMELLNTGRFIVIERNQMENILGEQGFQMTGCTSDECAVQMGRLLGVDRIIAGSVGRVGQTHSVILRMIDVESGMIIASNNVDCSCTIDEVMTSSLKAVAWQLAGLTPDEAIVASRIPNTGEGNLFVKSDPPGATVFVDDERQKGISPIVIEKLATGQHEIKLVKVDLVGFAIVNIHPGEVTQIDVTLKKSGEIIIKANVQEGTISIDGNTQRTTFPITLGSLYAGLHEIEVSSPGHETYKESITVEADKKVKLDIKLKREIGVISFAEIPRGTTVFLDGKKLGSTPIPDKTVNTGWYVIKLQRPGFTSSGDRDIELKKDEVYKVKYDLETISSTKGGGGGGLSVFPKSLILAGWGQRSGGRKLAGWIYTIGEIASVGILLAGMGDYSGKLNDYYDAEEVYLALPDNASDAEYRAAYNEKILKFEDAESAQSSVGGAAALVIGFYVLNIVDGLIFGGADGLAMDTNHELPTLSLKNIEDSGGRSSIGVSLGITFGKTGRVDR